MFKERCVYCHRRRLFHWRPYWHPFSLTHWRDIKPDWIYDNGVRSVLTWQFNEDD